MGSTPDTRLNSWKEIAGYLGRDLRTVQRWEREKGLPVHRVPGGKRQAVFAFQGEIDCWLQAGASGISEEPRKLARPVGARRHWLGIAAALVLIATAGLAAHQWLHGSAE